MRTIFGTAALLWFASVSAQTFPSAPVRIVIGVSAGGLSDVLARGMAQELSKTWKQPVIIENRTGASDVLATSLVVKSAPDGHTVLQTAAGTVMANEFLRKSLPYDHDKDLAPVAGVVRTNSLLIAGEKAPIRSVRELVDLAKAKPDSLFYGSFGIASTQHLLALELSQLAGISTKHVPYKGGSDVIRALLSKDIHYSFTAITPSLPFVKSGEIKALGYAGERRWPGLPDVPTLRELGYNVRTASWLVWFVPSATPKEVIGKIAADASRVLQAPAFRDRFIYGAGLDDLHTGPAATAELLAETRRSYAARVVELELKPR
jgi:tripartite-type tricarboxylate transporter receptor subunit TctC